MDDIPSTRERFLILPHALCERVQEEGVILDSQTDTYFGLNESGMCVWEALASGDSIEEAAHHLVAEFGIPLEAARADAISLVRELIDRRLIQRAPGVPFD
jgi:hypothetical protein